MTTIENSIHVPNVKRIETWKAAVDRLDLNSKEYITDVYTLSFEITEFNCLQQIDSVKLAALKEEVEQLKPWNYYIPGICENTDPHSVTNFHRYRARLISQAVQKLLGESIKNKTLLDIACNCGVFSLEMGVLGFKKVVGVDFRSENVNRAKLLSKLIPVSNVTFVTGDIENIDVSLDNSEVVLNLGLMYHLKDPLDGMKQTFDMSAEFAVIDSITHKEAFSGFHLVTNKDTSSSLEGPDHYELQPTYRGLVDSMYAVGFKHVIEIEGTQHESIDLYGAGVRRCFIAFKETPSIQLLNCLNT